MKTGKTRTATLLLFTGASVLLVLPGCTMPGSRDAELATQNAQRLEKLKGLEGRWEGTDRYGDASTPIVVTYRVTAGGSSVMETIAPDTPREMVTLYTLDGADLVLTHYCMLGNQPRMLARKGSDGERIDFDFAGCGNLGSPADPHMHRASFTFVDEDHLRTEWTLYRDAKPTDPVVFELERAKN